MVASWWLREKMEVHLVTVAPFNLGLIPPPSENFLNTTIEQHLRTILMTKVFKGRRGVAFGFNPYICVER